MEILEMFGKEEKLSKVILKSRFARSIESLFDFLWWKIVDIRVSQWSPILTLYFEKKVKIGLQRLTCISTISHDRNSNKDSIERAKRDGSFKLP